MSGWLARLPLHGIGMTDDGAVGAKLGPWKPLSVDDAAEVMAGYGSPWWIAGGWAIDLHLRRQTRPHADIDVVVLCADLPSVQDRLRDWDLHAADPPGQLRPWDNSKPLPRHVQDIWCRRTPASPWQLQLMIAETAGHDWVYRRDPRIRLPVPALYGPASTPRRPVLAPEIQLLHKSKNVRPKDDADFRAALPALDGRQRRWLHDALTLATPAHPWLTHLSDGRAASNTSDP
jgi:Aminoglycoside-2''-adenylyltransferase